MRAFWFLAIIVLFVTPSAAQPFILVDLLPELAGGTSVGSGTSFTDAGDLAGFYVGYSTDGLGVKRAVVWSVLGGTPTIQVAPPLDPSKDSWANHVGYDATGATLRVAGVSINAMDELKPTMWTIVVGDTGFAVSYLPTINWDPASAGPSDLSSSSVGFEGSAVSFMYTLDKLGVVGSSYNGVADKPVFWDATPPALPTVTPLPDYGPGSAGEATDIIVFDVNNLVACGWVTDALNDTTPPFWKSMNGGTTWTMQPLPLLPLATQGTCNKLISTAGPSTLLAAGTSETTGGHRHAVLWKSMDGGENWTVTDLGAANGLPNSEGLGAATLGDGLPVYIAGRSYGTTGTETATLWIQDGMSTMAYDVNDLNGGCPCIHRSMSSISIFADGAFICTGVATDVPPPAGRTDAFATTPVGPHAWFGESTVPTGIDARPLPARVSLFVSASPNPFSDQTSVAYGLGIATQYRLGVYDVAGRRVAQLASGTGQAGDFNVIWNGIDDRGRRVPSGVYFVRLNAGGSVASDKIVLFR